MIRTFLRLFLKFYEYIQKILKVILKFLKNIYRTQKFFVYKNQVIFDEEVFCTLGKISEITEEFLTGIKMQLKQQKLDSTDKTTVIQKYDLNSNKRVILLTSDKYKFYLKKEPSFVYEPCLVLITVYSEEYEISISNVEHLLFQKKNVETREKLIFYNEKFAIYSNFYENLSKMVENFQSRQ